MSIRSSNKDSLFTEINITPLTDIFLVLLIIMMVMAPMFQAVDQDIKLPSINNGLSVEEKEVTVSVTRKSQFYINTEPVKVENLTEKLKLLLEEAKDKKLVVKADTQTKTKQIMKVIKAAQVAGYEKLVVAGEPLSQKQQTKLEERTILED